MIQNAYQLTDNLSERIVSALERNPFAIPYSFEEERYDRCKCTARFASHSPAMLRQHVRIAMIPTKHYVGIEKNHHAAEDLHRQVPCTEMLTSPMHWRANAYYEIDGQAPLNICTDAFGQYAKRFTPEELTNIAFNKEDSNIYLEIVTIFYTGREQAQRFGWSKRDLRTPGSWRIGLHMPSYVPLYRNEPTVGC